jgi:hypothetical protein
LVLDNEGIRDCSVGDLALLKMGPGFIHDLLERNVLRVKKHPKSKPNSHKVDHRCVGDEVRFRRDPDLTLGFFRDR